MMRIFINLDVLWKRLTGGRIELSADAVKYTTQEIKLNSRKINQIIQHSYKNIETSLKECVDQFIND